MMLGSLYAAASTGYPFCNIKIRQNKPINQLSDREHHEKRENKTVVTFLFELNQRESESFLRKKWIMVINEKRERIVRMKLKELKYMDKIKKRGGPLFKNRNDAN